jgi:hypothetical protein
VAAQRDDADVAVWGDADFVHDGERAFRAPGDRVQPLIARDDVAAGRQAE